MCEIVVDDVFVLCTETEAVDFGWEIVLEARCTTPTSDYIKVQLSNWYKRRSLFKKKKKNRKIEDKETREKAEDVGRKMRRGKQREMSLQAEDGVEEHVM